MRLDCIFPATSNVSTGSKFASGTKQSPAVANAQAGCRDRPPPCFFTFTPQRPHRSSARAGNSRSRQGASQSGQLSQGELFSAGIGGKHRTVAKATFREKPPNKAI